jgi:hypothetical protein
MPLIDDRGRLFGKVNLIDALVGLVVLLLIPLAYGAFLLFRVPAPSIASLEPASFPVHQVTSVRLTGQNLRPFLRARTGSVDLPLFVQSPTLAEIKVGDLPAGTYDVVLYDQGQELTRKPAAFTILGPAPTQLDIQALGAFTGMEAAEAERISAVSSFRASAATAPVAEIVAARPAEPDTTRVKIGINVFAMGVRKEYRVPAIVRIHCNVANGECRVGDVAVAPNATLALPLTAGQVQFTIDQVFPASMPVEFPSMATLRVQFVASPEIFNVIKVGDVDVSGLLTDTKGAVLQELGSERRTTTVNANSEPLLRRNLQVQQAMVIFNGVLRAPLTFTPAGWSYHDQLVKVGAVFNFETASGAMGGWILDVKIEPEQARSTK